MITKQIMRRYMIYWIILLAAFLLLLFLCWFVFRQFVWFADDPYYTFFKILEGLSPFLIFAGMVIGTLILMRRAIRESLEYVDITLEGARQLSEPDLPIISLPPELIDVQNELNIAREHIRRNTEIAADAEKRKNDLIMYLAHDLKTPLASVIGYINLLQDTEGLPEETRRKYLDITLDKAERLEDLINEFFDIARFNLSQVVLEQSRVDLTRMLEQTVFEFLPMFQEKHLQCLLELKDPVMIICDAEKLQRVFDNILRNAVAYSYEQSEIRITGEQTEQQITLHFINHGATIPKEKRDRIFDQFYRVDASRSTQGGSGLGLAIARQIVELHGGTIAAESADNMTEITVLLPVL